MIGLGQDLKVVLATQPVDFRCGITRLSALVQQALDASPYCGDIFVFRSKRMDRLKLIVWDGSGMILLTKWLEEGKFVWPPVRDGVARMSSAQLSLLLAGLDWTRLENPRVKRPVLAG